VNPWRGRGAVALVSLLRLCAGCAHNRNLDVATPPRSCADGTAEADADPLPQLTDEELEERSRFLEERLRKNRKLASLWQYGWTSFYAAGLVVESGWAAGDDESRADHVVSASKAAIGVLVRSLRPPRSVRGDRPLRDLPVDTRVDKANRLLAAEALLAQDARESDRRYAVLAHATNVVLNVAGGLIVGLGYNDWKNALASSLIGVSVGEIMIWTQPWQGKRDWQSYRQRYGAPASVSARSCRRSLGLAPSVGLHQASTSLALSF
jgi:hypothetical protein